jgi:MinD-like ATPase involved in chromosome partitioning or flagellar assembly
VQVGTSLNEGKPIVLQPKSKFARDMRALAAALAGPQATNGKVPSRLPMVGLLRRNDSRKKAR